MILLSYCDFLFFVFIWHCLSFPSCSVQIVRSDSIKYIFNQWLWRHQRYRYEAWLF